MIAITDNAAKQIHRMLQKRQQGFIDLICGYTDLRRRLIPPGKFQNCCREQDA